VPKDLQPTEAGQAEAGVGLKRGSGLRSAEPILANRLVRPDGSCPREAEAARRRRVASRIMSAWRSLAIS
jgi:hypothetical protein